MRQTRLVVGAAVPILAALACCAWPSRSDSPHQPEQPAAMTARSLLDRAHEELLRSDVKQYAAILLRAISASGTPVEHSRAQAEYANYLWRILGDVPAARKVLSDAGEQLPALLLERARLELFVGDFAASRAVALQALNESQEIEERRLAQTTFAHAVAAQAIDVALQPRQTSAELDDLMRQALTFLRRYVNDEPGLRDPSRFALLAALWCGDGTTALSAWESYYRLAPRSEALPPLRDVASTLRQLLPSFSDNSADTHVKIIEALSASRFFPEAAALAAHWNLGDSASTRDLVEYVRWTAALAREFDEGYRQVAVGKKTISGRERLDRSAPDLWRRLRGTAEYSFDSFLLEIGNRFGAVVHTLPTGVNYGHIIADQLENIEQYGRKAQLRSIVLDSMVSNGYTTWLWDGRAQIGGWASDSRGGKPSIIVSVRSDSALSAWSAISDPKTMHRNKENLERWQKEDDNLARKNPYVFLPGLRLRMFLSGARRVYDLEAGKGLKGPALRAAFLADYARLQEAAMISAHEGRHALDRQSHELSLGVRLLFGASEELEYRAKLSEMTFAPDPLLATNAIFSSDIGTEGSAHGMANLRVMKGLAAWMRLHSNEIKGLDPLRPLLPQFDQLSDEQMRAAFRSMDPWAK